MGRDLARLERICRTPETNASSMKWGMLRLLACRRRCRVIRACAVDTHDGEVESEATSDLRSWTGTQIYAHGIVCQGRRKFRAICGTPSAWRPNFQGKLRNFRPPLLPGSAVEARRAEAVVAKRLAQRFVLGVRSGRMY